jgi:hypothetical protein
MRNLRLAGTSLGAPEDVVAWHGAMQAQEYLPAQWSLAQRATGLSRDDVDRAVAEGAIIRVHALRPTWHFLARDDARWVLRLTGPRVRKGLASRYRELGLDPRTLTRAQSVILTALGDGKHLTRRQLANALTKSRVDTTGQRLAHMLMHCELDLAICSGARHGNDHTYAPLDDRVPPAEEQDSADATRILVERYLRSHGPASVKDIKWWATLTAASVRAALDELGHEVASATIDEVELWWIDGGGRPAATPGIRLLETFDEYIVGYTRSRFLGDPRAAATLAAWRERSSLRNIVVRNGMILGLWRRTRSTTGATVEVTTYGEPSASVLASLRAEANKWGRFYGVESKLEVTTGAAGS